MLVAIIRHTWLVLLSITMLTQLSFGQNEDGPQERRINPELRELFEAREELSHYLEELTLERKQTEQQLRETNELIQLHRRLAEAEADLGEVERGLGEDERLRIISEIEESIESIHQRRELRSTTTETVQLQSRISDYLEEAEHEPEQGRLFELQKALAAGAADLNRMMVHLDRKSSPNASPDRDGSDLKDELGRLESSVARMRDLSELMQETNWAFEEDEYEEVQELLRELHGELLSTSQPSKHAQSHKMPPAARLLPVEVNEQQLAQYADRDFDKSVVPLLRTFCFDCHSNDASYGELNLEQLIEQKPLVVNRKRWINVIEQTKNRVMPPEDGVQPGESEREALVLSLHNMIHNFDYKGIDNPGFEATRRLTHEEYDNTVSDLFGVEVEIATRFPKELAGTSGFNNSGNTLFVQPLLLERYLTAADEIVSELLPDVASNPRQRKALSRVYIRESATGQNTKMVAQGILNRFVSYAYRRPLTDEEKERLAERYQTLLKSGVPQEGIRTIIRETLVSPNFLFRFEELQSKTDKYRVNDWELASRLSYFLWASMPDDELFMLAKANKLHQPEILEGQVLRMLKSPKANALGEHFAAQWLGSQHIGTRVRLDPIDNPWCTDSLMFAMREETALFFTSLVRDNARIGDLITGEYTFVNDELAKLYGIRGVRGSQMRRIELPSQDRGGILGHASVLAATSFPYRTSPVVRGKWVLDTLLGTPPPPPPPNVSELSDELLENERLTVREKLERHRQSPSCNACHSEMDPLGLALEKYDWFGRDRDRYERGRIDTRGSLPNGTQFDGITGLRRVIIDQRHDALVRQVTSKLLSYALGRQLEYYDEPAVRKLLKSIESKEFRFQPLVTGIVLSEPFQFKQVQTADAGLAQSPGTGTAP
ncbi:MAG: hypothetical protein Aurels2KO_14290 [Aureliella sp.]